jgi:transmembrane sensor
MPTADTSADLDEQAIAWVILLHSGQASTEDLARLTAWRNLSDAHDKTYQHACQLWQDMGEALQQNARPTSLRSQRYRPPPRRFSKPLAIAASLLLFGLGLNAQSLTDALLHDYSTRHGEQKTLVLADGSHVMLNTDTALDVAFDSKTRRVRLVHGQAWFHVEADPARPFEVAAANHIVRALGTAFDVRNDNAEGVLIVQEHAVAVRSTVDPFAEVRVAEGERLDFSTSSAKPEKADVPQATAWQRHKLIFDGQPLAQVVAELNRYSDSKIWIADAALRQRAVTGVFPLDDPEGNLRTIQATLHLRMTWFGPWWGVLRS